MDNNIFKNIVCSPLVESLIFVDLHMTFHGAIWPIPVITIRTSKLSRALAFVQVSSQFSPRQYHFTTEYTSDHMALATGRHFVTSKILWTASHIVTRVGTRESIHHRILAWMIVCHMSLHRSHHDHFWTLRTLLMVVRLTCFAWMLVRQMFLHRSHQEHFVTLRTYLLFGRLKFMVMSQMRMRMTNGIKDEDEDRNGDYRRGWGQG